MQEENKNEYTQKKLKRMLDKVERDINKTRESIEEAETERDKSSLKVIIYKKAMDDKEFSYDEERIEAFMNYQIERKEKMINNITNLYTNLEELYADKEMYEKLTHDCYTLFKEDEVFFADTEKVLHQEEKLFEEVM